MTMPTDTGKSVAALSPLTVHDNKAVYLHIYENLGEPEAICKKKTTHRHKLTAAWPSLKCVYKLSSYQTGSHNCYIPILSRISTFILSLPSGNKVPLGFTVAVILHKPLQ